MSNESENETEKNEMRVNEVTQEDVVVTDELRAVILETAGLSPGILAGLFGSLKPEPIPLRFVTRALTLGVDKITLHWSGGSDEGYLHVSFSGEEVTWDTTRELETEITTWGEETYQYNGAGDGTSYGDDITYYLKEGRVSVQEWAMVRQEGSENFDTMETL